MTPIPHLETERLILRAPGPEDVEPYAAFYASEQADWLGGRLTRDEAWTKLAAMIGHWRLRGFGRWVVARKSDGAYCGHCGLHFPEGWPEPELAWSVTATAQGQGIAFEAASAARAFAYETAGWTTAISLVAADNGRSAALAERLGAVFEREIDFKGHAGVRVYRHPSPAELRRAAA
ncbi:MAG: GNAT family N-acetyltransferase [Pseudomonadota bacterium]